MKNTRQRLYLDHAATSWPKSESVLNGMLDFTRSCGVAAGRGGYQSAVQADQVVTKVRRQIAALIESPNSDCISFHANGTAALNVAIQGVVRDGEHVVVSAAEHNSVLRPLDHLVQRGKIRLRVVPVGHDGKVDAEEFLAAIEPDTRLAALTHASNVTGVVQPVEQVGEGLSSTSTLFLCDAAQTFGAIPVSVSSLNADLLAAPGHKSSGGPLGTAFLYTAPELHDEFQLSVFGGTGSQSESLEMPHAMPGKLEPGNLNVPAIAGWEKALSDLEDLESRKKQNHSLAEVLLKGLRAISGLKVYGANGPLPMASISIDGLPPSDFAAILDSEFGIETRSGLHCAALIHEFLGTSSEGTLRISAGVSTGIDEIMMALDAVSQISQEFTGG